MFKCVILAAVCVAVAHAGYPAEPLWDKPLPPAPIVKPAPLIITKPVIKTYYKPEPVLLKPAPLVVKPAPIVWSKPAPLLWAKPAPLVWTKPAPIVKIPTPLYAPKLESSYGEWW